MKAVAYMRVSTGEQSASGLGLDAQRQAIEAAVAARGWELVLVEEDSASGKSVNGRSGLRRALAMLKAGEADVLIVAKLDRLSRSLFDLTAMTERREREGWQLVALDLGVDTSTPSGEAMLNMMGVFAQLERRMIGMRTKEALAVARSRGVRLGRPPVLSDDVRGRIRELRAAGASLTSIAETLSDDGVATAHGGLRWYPSTVRKVLASAA